MISIRQATVHDVDNIAPLFDAYRRFYGQAPDVALARAFLLERLAHHESAILMACDATTVVGFTQLYPSFSSTMAAPIYVLNDLYVDLTHRRSGVGRLLLQEAVRYARAMGAISLTLSTAHTNTAAQRLYESLGWRLDEEFRTYFLPTGAS